MSSFSPVYDLVEDETVVSPKRYLDILRTEPGSIVSARFIPPRLGDTHFGRVAIVRRDSPRNDVSPRHEVLVGAG